MKVGRESSRAPSELRWQAKEHSKQEIVAPKLPCPSARWNVPSPLHNFPLGYRTLGARQRTGGLHFLRQEDSAGRLGRLPNDFAAVAHRKRDPSQQPYIASGGAGGGSKLGAEMSSRSS